MKNIGHLISKYSCIKRLTRYSNTHIEYGFKWIFIISFLYNRPGHFHVFVGEGNKMFRRTLGKALGFGAVLVQYGCMAHCTLEFVGDFVVVSQNFLS